jgi:hypothetical protein
MPKPQKVKPAEIDRINRPTLKYFHMHELPIRPGAIDILNKPSRVCNTLFYPDGSAVRSEQ